MNHVILSTEAAARVLEVLRTVGTGLNEIEAQLTTVEAERSKLLSGEFVGELFGLVSVVEAAISESGD